MNVKLIGKHEKDSRACRDGLALTLDEELVVKAAKETGAIVTAENHNVTCGLGSVVANCLSRNAPTVQEFVGVQDQFGQVGPQDFLMDEYGLRAANIVAAVKKAIARK